MSQLQHNWSLLCLRSSIDSENNNISLFSVLESLQVSREAFKKKKETPEASVGAAIDFQLVTLWSKKTGEIVRFKEEVSIIDPRDEVLFKKGFDVEIKRNVKRTRSVLNFHGFPLTVPGDYKLTVAADGEVKSITYLEVNSK